jgi:hypothetical protein
MNKKQCFFNDMLSLGIPDILAEIIKERCSYDDFEKAKEYSFQLAETDSEKLNYLLKELQRMKVLPSVIYCRNGNEFFIVNPQKENDDFLFGTLIYRTKEEIGILENYLISKEEYGWRSATPSELENLSLLWSKNRRNVEETSLGKNTKKHKN